MSECPAPGAVENPAGQPAEGLTPEETEAILDEFRAWLREATAAGALDTNGTPPEDALDLHTLLSQFIALRQEVNLQTRAVRAQQEQNAETLRQLGQALELAQAPQANLADAYERAAEEQFRSIVKGLLDARDALDLARREVERVQQTLPSAVEPSARGWVDELGIPRKPEWEEEPADARRDTTAPSGFWARLLGQTPQRPAPVPTSAHAQQLRVWADSLEAALAAHRDALERQREQTLRLAEAAEQVRVSFDSVAIGYNMSLQRLERTLQLCGLEAIPCVGEPFDPELMEVVELDRESDRPANEVVEEVRRGFLWRGRVFRFAQVRVAKPQG